MRTLSLAVLAATVIACADRPDTSSDNPADDSVSAAGAASTAAAETSATSPATSPPADPALAAALQLLATRAAPGVLGVAVLDLQTGAFTGVNADRHFPMQSVFKAPLGAVVLAAVDAGRLSLDSTVVLTRADLSPPYSPIADAWPEQDRYTVRELLERTVGGSDNTGADVLMRMVGGPPHVTEFLQSHGIDGMRVDRYEREFQPESVGLPPFREEWLGEEAFVAAFRGVPEEQRRTAMRSYLADERDTSTPRASTTFLASLQAGDLLTPASTALLLDIMTRSPTGASRIRAGLPEDATFAHKTGTGRADLGVASAVNDIGIVTLDDGRRFALASYLAGATLDAAERERLHADVARAIFAGAS